MPSFGRTLDDGQPPAMNDELHGLDEAERDRRMQAL